MQAKRNYSKPKNWFTDLNKDTHKEPKDFIVALMVIQNYCEIRKLLGLSSIEKGKSQSQIP